MISNRRVKEECSICKIKSTCDYFNIQELIKKNQKQYHLKI